MINLQRRSRRIIRLELLLKMNEVLQQLSGLTLILAIFQAQDLSSSCDMVSFHHCVNQLSDYKRKSEGGLVVYYNRDLDDVCRIFDDISVCVWRATSTCFSEEHFEIVAKHWSGLNSSLTFLCHRGKQNYLKLHKCFVQPRFERSIKQCNKTLHMKREFTHSEYEHCHLEKEFINCIGSSTNEHCGPEAAVFERTIVKKIKQPFLDFKDCMLKSPTLRFNSILVLTTTVIHVTFKRTC